MGMYDYVHVELACPACGTTVTDFQTKDAACQLDIISPERINRFYTDCVCGKWIEFDRTITHDLHPLRDKPYNRTEITEMGFKLVG